MTDIFLYAGEASPNDVKLRDPTAVSGRVDYVLTCAAGAYVYAGNAASLIVARSLPLAVGAYSYTGNAAVLTYTPGTPAGINYTLLCSAGTYAYAGSNADLSYVSGQARQGGIKHLRATFRGVETEEQKRLRREAQGIIKRIQKAQPEQATDLQEEAEGISAELRAAIERLELAADAFEQAMKAKQAAKAQRQAQELQSLLIEAQLQAEILQQQVEEMDVAFVMFMLAAHL